MAHSNAAANTPVWDDGAWTPLSSLPGTVETDTCVIGLGGSGLTALRALHERGVHCVGVDAVDVGAGAAGRNGGFLLAGTYDFYHDAVRRHGHERALHLYQATLAEIPRIAAAAPGTVRFMGSRRLAASAWEIDDCRAQMAAMQADGLPVSWVEDAHGVGLFFPQDASFNPLRRCRVLATQLRTADVPLFASAHVTHLDGTTVHTAHGRVVARRVIVAVDGHLEQLLPEVRDVVRTARLQMLATAPTAEISVPCPMYYREGYEYWQQTEDGALTIGGFRDQAGDGEWSHDATLTAAVQDRLEAFVRTHLGVTAPVTHRWAACAAYTTTGLPLLGEMRPGVFAMGGYSGTGNVMGALCANALVALACDGDAAPQHALRGTT